jgi:predicted transcriptional regulator
MGKKKSENQSCNIRLPAKLRKRVRRLAFEREVPISLIIEEALEAHLARGAKP